MVQQLQGHQYQVTGVGTTPSGQIVSSSLDKSLKIWQNGECKATLEGHEGPINCMVVLPDGNTTPSTEINDSTMVATGSGDKTVRFWSLSQQKCTKIINAHEDTVRTLAVLPNIGIVSGSHDFTLKIWTLSGELVTEMVGHTRIIFTAAVSPDSSVIASGADDNTARVWRVDGTCLQVLEHPGCVWAVTFLPNGDLVTACADGVARIWTRNEERKATADGLEIFNATLTAYKDLSKPKEEGTAGDGSGQPAGLPAGLRLSNADALNSPGSNDGQTIVVMEGLAGIAYSWNAGSNEWERLGEVLAGPDGGGADAGGSVKKMLDGVEWDYVIDVDVADGAPPLKLAMNADENPYFVADRFIERHDLPVTYKEQIVQFIMQNTTASGGAGGSGGGGGGSYVDPYTGASAYVPAPPGASTGMNTTFPTNTSTNYGVTGGGVDPFTGSGRPVAAVSHLPAKSFYLFEAPPPVEGLRKKMAEFNNALKSDPVTASFAVEDADMADEGPLGALLTAAAIPAGQSGRVFDASVVTSILPQLLRWPAPQLFPCLDLARVVMLDPTGAATLANTAAEPMLTAPAGSLGRALAEACCADPPVPASQQVALRCMTNCFAQPPLQTWARTHLNAFLALSAPCVSSTTKGVRLGAATLLVNVALALTKLPGDELESKSQVVALAIALLGACPGDDEEPRYRALVAIGTLLPEHSQIRSGAKQMGMLEMCSTLQASSGKVGEVAREVASLIRL